ncbi:MAG: hypothetical protein AOA65_0429 [Candidatus Bathyarchaeota archaeon BA1]|nr:MAG: hypothetical protein AOA65_0429 [Candidatus Bathyarchaeota archaeon BA1]
MYQLTLNELERFGFPVNEVELVMPGDIDLEDYLTSAFNVRSRLFFSLTKQYRVVRVVDDYPKFFDIYRQFDVPNRIGLLRPKRFTPQEYFTHGATRVIKEWKQLYEGTSL